MQLGQQKGKPDYVAALLGVLCCACAFFLLSQQRRGPMTLSEQLDGVWDIQETDLPLGTVSAKESTLTWNSTSVGSGQRMFGVLKRDSSEGEYYILAETLSNKGMLVVQVGGDGEDEPIELLRAAYEINELNPAAKVAFGKYETRANEIGTFELLYSGSEITMTTTRKGGDGVTSYFAHRGTDEPSRNELVEKATIGFLIFIIAVVVSIVRNVLFIRPRNERLTAAAAAAKQQPKGKKKGQKVPGVSG
eukprot:TRINITY_DN9070_c3_g1_i2.p1 TRINITY_DN9070_c3_g1~~TRINITY_DN9070_c3_g1_i2.p1  ORF type:complete len:248 (+),score=45.42 TRINITY_DN9070_c3_g1_i2:88-831(+)